MQLVIVVSARERRRARAGIYLNPLCQPATACQANARARVSRLVGTGARRDDRLDGAMQLIEVYRGFEILSDELGFVVFDPASTTDDRLAAVRELARAEALDALWFSSLLDARDSVDRFIEQRQAEL